MSGAGAAQWDSKCCKRVYCVLTDVSTEIIDIMRDRFAGDARVRVEEADCRQMTFLSDGAADVVVDKGTLDALSGEDHKRDMLRECSR
jgi:ubiquinone/menaquinone biosynthesis C-methylase UbiE